MYIYVYIYRACTNTYIKIILFMRKSGPNKEKQTEM